MQSSKSAFVTLIRLGIGLPSDTLINSVNWSDIEAIAIQQGLLGIVVDGIEKLPEQKRPPKKLLLQWIGQVMQDESRFAILHKAACDMSLLFHENYIRTYVLKGEVVSECYPKQQHRVSSDIDCFLLPEKSDFDAWSLGNELIKSKGLKFSDGFYKNSTFHLPGATVENHRFMVPFRGNKRLRKLEVMLEGMLREDKGKDRFEGTWLYRPPVIVTSLFLIEHAYSHFLHEGLTWRHVIDWTLYSRNHKEDLNWDVFETLIDESGFRKFYDAFDKISGYLLGEIREDNLSKNDKRLLADVWSPLDLHDTLQGVKGKLALAGNTIRAWWKYHYFADISMIHALWIQAYGVLFDKNPTLD